MEEEQKKSHKGVIVLVIVLVALAALYVLGIIYFNHHFYPRTTVNGVDVSLDDASAAADQIDASAESYILTITDRDGRVNYIKGKDIDYSVDSFTGVQQALTQQHPLIWIYDIFQVHSQTVEMTADYDEAKLSDAIDALDCLQEENIVAPQDAYIGEKDGTYQIIEEVAGSQPDKDKLTEDIRTAISTRTERLDLDDSDYVSPSVLSTDEMLQKKLDVLNTYASMTVTYDTWNGTAEVLDSNTIMSWLTVNDDMSVTIDQDKVNAYVLTLAQKYNTSGSTRDFNTTTAGTIQIGGGDYGWIVDKEAEAAQLTADIQNGESVERAPCYSQKGFTDDADIGNTYIELDYTSQHLWYYNNGTLVFESDFVSGNMSQNNGSPDGVFKIISKQKDVTLKGEGYSSPVTYFMPFAYNVGLHDASWRSSFGGSIYQTDGSHGCINLPYDIAEQIYNVVDIGTPVIGYYETEVQLTNVNSQMSNAYSYKAQ